MGGHYPRCNWRGTTLQTKLLHLRPAELWVFLTSGTGWSVRALFKSWFAECKLFARVGCCTQSAQRLQWPLMFVRAILQTWATCYPPVISVRAILHLLFWSKRKDFHRVASWHGINRNSLAIFNPLGQVTHFFCGFSKVNLTRQLPNLLAKLFFRHKNEGL